MAPLSKMLIPTNDGSYCCKVTHSQSGYPLLAIFISSLGRSRRA